MQEICSTAMLQTVTCISDVNDGGPCDIIQDDIDSLWLWAMLSILLNISGSINQSKMSSGLVVLQYHVQAWSKNAQCSRAS